MSPTPTYVRLRETPTADQIASAVRGECERALVRLGVLIRESDDVLLVQARDAVRRAAALSSAQLRAQASDRREPSTIGS
jgi:hypothetical protein